MYRLPRAYGMCLSSICLSFGIISISVHTWWSLNNWMNHNIFLVYFCFIAITDSLEAFCDCKAVKLDVFGTGYLIWVAGLRNDIIRMNYSLASFSPGFRQKISQFSGKCSPIYILGNVWGLKLHHYVTKSFLYTWCRRPTWEKGNLLFLRAYSLANMEATV